MASTSAFEIGFAAAAETVDVPADEAGVPAAVAAEVLFAEPADEGGAEEPAAAVTVAACLEPKMADTILPKRSFFPPTFAHALRPAPRLSSVAEQSFARVRGIRKQKSGSPALTR